MDIFPAKGKFRSVIRSVVLLLSWASGRAVEVVRVGETSDSG